MPEKEPTAAELLGAALARALTPKGDLPDKPRRVRLEDLDED